MDIIEENVGLAEIIATLAVIRIRFKVYLEIYEELKVTVSAEKISSEFEVFVDLCLKAKEIGGDKVLKNIAEAANEITGLYRKLMDIKSQN